MKWINTLENFNTSFHIHTLDKEDFVLLRYDKKNRRILYVLEGCTQLLRVFTNNEKVCLRILSKNQITINDCYNRKRENYCDLMLATAKTKIIAIPLVEIKNEVKKRAGVFIKTETQEDSIKDEVINILSHRNTKKRVVQLLIVLTKQLGYIKGNRIIVPTQLTHQAIAEITGSQKRTVSRIMKNLKHEKAIDYSNKGFIICNAVRLIQA